jgi:putative FmdB family regulatory protein
MPTYDYECQECGYRFELFHHVGASPSQDCPECGGQIKKLIGGGCGLIFKGSGFYITDYKKKSTPEESSSKAQAQGKKDNNSSSAANKDNNQESK